MARPRKSASASSAATSGAAAAFKAIDNLLWKPGSGCSGALDYMEQSSWLLFLRYLDAREDERRMEAELSGRPYEPILPEALRWGSWAWPAKPDGSLDADRALAGEELVAFVKETLFPGLRSLKDGGENAKRTDSVHYVVGSIFEQLTCKFTNGFLLREVIALMQPLRFQTEAERHEMSVLYEERLGAMGNAGRDGGQYYTPRPLIRVMVRILDPKLGETFDDGACGSGGFLCEAFRHMREAARDDPGAWRILQKETFSGGEVKPLAYVTAQMNCILHGLETPRIAFGDTLAAHVADFSESDRVNVIGANPPFGAGADPASAANFSIPSSETALLFLQYFIAKLKRGGRAAIIIKNTFLSNTDNASVAVRRLLLEKCRLRWVLDLPQKVFTAGVRTVVLFFTKDGPTADPIRYYQLDLPGVSLGKRRPLLESDLAQFESLVRGDASPDGVPATWSVDPATLDPATLDLSVKNPNIEEERLPSSAECEIAIRATWEEIGKWLGDSCCSEPMIAGSGVFGGSWPRVKLGEVCEVAAGDSAPQDKALFTGGTIPFVRTSDVGAIHFGVLHDSRDHLTERGATGLRRFRPGSILFPKSGASTFLDHRVLLEVKACVASHLAVISPNPVLDSRYLLFALSQVKARDLLQDSSYPALRASEIEQISLALPPLPVQRDIVARLDAELARVDRMRERFFVAAKSCAALRAALLKESFE